jgi:O-antigen/teichoic acid export membrane protein
MSNRNRLARNVVWNWAGTATQMAAGFMVAPFLVHKMGDTGYGLWILIASLTGYFDVLDLGLRASVGRNMALFRARDDDNGLTSVFSTGCVLLCAQAIAVILGTSVFLVAFFHLFNVPPDQVATVRLALLLVAINLGAIYLFSIFDAVIWSLERFDVLNAVDIPSVLARMLLTFWFISGEDGLLTLAWITLAVTVIAGIAKAVISLWLDKRLRFELHAITFETARGLFGFGVWCFVMTLAKISTAQIGPLIVGSRLGIGLVTPFSIVARLVGYSKAILLVSTGVFTPLTTAFHATQQKAEQQTLFVKGGRHCLAFAVFFAGFFTLLGKPLIGIWIGPQMDFAWPVLLILSAGEVLPMSQGITDSLLLGMARHRTLAMASLVELLTSLSLLACLTRPYGLIGAAVSFAIPATLCRGIVPMFYTCHVLGVSQIAYLRQTAAPVIALAAGPIVALYAAVMYHMPDSWLELFFFAGLYSLLYFVSASVAIFGIVSLNPYRYARVRSFLGLPETY